MADRAVGADDARARDGQVTARARPSFAELTAPGVAAVRHHWRPFVAIQAVALVLVLLYFFVPAVHRACERLAELREAGGYPAAMLATALAGAILPELAKALTQRRWRLDRAKLADLAFLLPIFAVDGLIVDVFYRGLGVLYGTGQDPLTVALKVVTDQFGFAPLIAQPLFALVFTWRRLGFDAGAALREVGPRWYVRRVLALQIPGWVFWTPIVVLVYALPSALQFVLFVLAMAAWSLVLVFIGNEDPPAVAA